MNVLEPVLVAVEELTARRILLFFMRYDLRIQLASLVRGSSRRITIVRFRPADIRVINRRNCFLPATSTVSSYWRLKTLFRGSSDRLNYGFT
jgi:hypothetical protein